MPQRKSSVVEQHSSHGKLAGGLNTSPSLFVDTFIMHCVVMEEKGVWLLASKKFWLTGLIPRYQPSINSMDASGTIVLPWGLPVTGILE